MFKFHSISTQTTSQYFLPRTHWVLLLACIAVAVVGCGTKKEESASTNTEENQLPVISGSQLNEYLIDSSLPVLVEFGVDFNCSRCAQTKNAVLDLRESLSGEVDVIRVDFNSNAQTVAELGGTICPTYVLFDQGKPVLTRSFPVSIGLLEGDILRQFGQ
ncbi:MAG TPA: hypothetical protein DEF45_10140 [Rhodopirellula sp.]|nr:hypothetical protein [Rhodopirellula sp.]